MRGSRGLRVLWSGLVAVLGLLPVVLAAPAYGAAEQERVDSYGVRLQVGRNGDLHVTETIAYHFAGTARHGIVRTIPLRRHVDARHDRVIQIRGVRVQGPGGLTVTTSGDRTVLRVGNPNVTVSGDKTYVIDYDVPRALIPHGTANELSWNAVGTEWTVPVRAVTVNVSAPVRIASATCRYGRTGSTTACAGGPPDGSSVTFSRAGLAAGEGVTVDVGLPKDGMSVTPPPYEPRRAPFAPSVLGGVLVLMAAGSVAVIAFLFLPRRRRRLPAADATRPPAGVSPGLAGVLQSDGTPGSRHVAATVLDLAARGYLRLEETTDSDRTRVWQRVVRGDRPPGDLAPYEAAVVEGLLGTGDSAAMTLTGGHRWAAQEAIYDLLAAEARERGWFRRRRGPQRFRTALLATYLAAAAIVLFVAATTTASVAWVPTGGLGWAALAFLAAAVFAWFAGRRPARTAEGARAQAEVNAYAAALGTWRGQEADAALVSRLFPYAVAFGRTRGWGDVLEKVAGDLPWYVRVESSSGRETADRIKRSARMVAPRPWEVPGARRRGWFGFVASSGRYDSVHVGAAANYYTAGGFSGDAGGGAVGGGDGGGGGGGW